MGEIFAFCNQKGGVGKTTSAINIAATLSDAGHSVLLIDMDAQANATSGIGLEKKHSESTAFQLIVENVPADSLISETEFKNLSMIASGADLSGAELGLINLERREYRLSSRLREIKSKFEFIIIDCPPSLGLLTVNCLTAARYIIIPLQCEYYAMEGLGQLVSTYQLVRSNLNPELEIGGVLLTMADMRTNLTQQVIQEVQQYFKEKVFNTIIPRSVKLSEAPSFGKPAVFYDASSRGVKAYIEAAKEFSRRFSEKDFFSSASGENSEAGKNESEMNQDEVPSKVNEQN